MICPNCSAEYRDGFTRCADCDLDLVEPTPTSLATADPSTETEDPFCEFWKGEDPRLRGELCDLLAEAGIPYRSIELHLHSAVFSGPLAPLSFRIAIPFSLFLQAERIIEDAFGDDSPAAQNLHAPPQLPENLRSPE